MDSRKRARSCSGLGALIAGVLSLAGGIGAAPGAEAPGRVTVELTSYRFSPGVIEAEAGRALVLTLVNRSFIGHSFVLEHPEAGLDVDVELAPKTAYTVRFTPRQPGRYGFYCDQQLLFFESHRERGMVGTFDVQP